MTSPVEQQVEICLMKHSLEEIENQFVNHLLPALPYLEEANQQQILKTLNTLRESRSLTAKLNEEKLKTGQLMAQSERVQQEFDDIVKSADKVNEDISQLEQLIQEEEDGMRNDTLQYEAKLQEIIQKSRDFAYVYDEEVVRRKTEAAKRILDDLLTKEKILKNEVAEKKKILDGMKTDVPENILDIVGKTALEEKLKSLNICITQKLQNVNTNF